VKTSEERLNYIEHVLAGWAEQSRRDYEENRRLWRELRDQIAETDRRLKELGEDTDRRFRETEALVRKTGEEIRETNRYLKEMGAATDKRISDVVSAIGKLIAGREENGSKA
jgi:hypothetical protein